MVALFIYRDSFEDVCKAEIDATVSKILKKVIKYDDFFHDTTPIFSNSTVCCPYLQ